MEGESLPEPVASHPTGPDRGGSWLFALFAAVMVGQLARGFLRRMPAGVRALFGAAASGGIAWLLASAFLVGGIGAIIGFFIAIGSGSGGRFARQGGWGGFGGGGWGGGGFGGGSSGGGGWSGGDGMSGGGGASGSW